MAFWFLGLTNNFAYVIMLSAAHDIISINLTEDIPRKVSFVQHSDFFIQILFEIYLQNAF